MLKVVVDRSTWGRGKFLKGNSLLYSGNTRQMCCLGFAEIAAGNEIKNIKNFGAPQWGFSKIPSLVDPAKKEKQSNGCTKIANDLMRYNDLMSNFFDNTDFMDNEAAQTYATDEKYRECKLYTLGLKAGIKFEFVN